jgi:toxic protein SymE
MSFPQARMAKRIPLTTKQLSKELIMAASDFMPGFVIAQTNSDPEPEMASNPDLPRKRRANRLHGKQTNAATPHPRADTPDASNACVEIYSRMDGRYLPLSGDWLPNAGFIPGMPVKIRVMKDCIVITPQHTRELWGCLEGMSVAGINKQKIADWLKTFPGALHDLGDVPVIKRGR